MTRITQLGEIQYIIFILHISFEALFRFLCDSELCLICRKTHKFVVMHSYCFHELRNKENGTHKAETHNDRITAD